MNLTMHYTKRTYGGMDDEPDVVAKVSQQGRVTTVDFHFPMYALGRGSGDNVGTIRAASMTLKTDEAVALAQAILAVADGRPATELFFGSMTAKDWDELRRFEKWRKLNPKAPMADFLASVGQNESKGE